MTNKTSFIILATGVVIIATGITGTFFLMAKSPDIESSQPIVATTTNSNLPTATSTPIASSQPKSRVVAPLSISTPQKEYTFQARLLREINATSTSEASEKLYEVRLSGVTAAQFGKTIIIVSNLGCSIDTKEIPNTLTFIGVVYNAPLGWYNCRAAILSLGGDQ